MPRELFGDVTRPRLTVNTRKWYTVPLSLFAHVALVVPLVLAPLLASDVLPDVHDYVVLVAEGALPTEPPPPPPPIPREKPSAHKPVVNPSVAPTEAPDGIAPELPLSDPVAPVPPGVLPGMAGSDLVISEPPAPPPPPTPKRVRAGAEVQPPSKIRHVAPVYPAIAQTARVEGVVILQATIGVDGRVDDVRVLRSFPLLDQAAIDAVRQWEYLPTRLNGIPVSVVMTVTVTFTLNR